MRVGCANRGRRPGGGVWLAGWRVSDAMHARALASELALACGIAHQHADVFWPDPTTRRHTTCWVDRVRTIVRVSSRDWYTHTHAQQPPVRPLEWLRMVWPQQQGTNISIRKLSGHQYVLELRPDRMKFNFWSRRRDELWWIGDCRVFAIGYVRNLIAFFGYKLIVNPSIITRIRTNQI